MKPKVSIIIPVYNVEQYLEQSLNSVINQTLKEIEIICIDDCSTDGSLNILKEYAQKDNRIKIVKQERNQGQGVARNIGIDVALGEYIMFLDPDDWLEVYACENAYNQIHKNNNDIVFFNYFNYSEYTYSIIMRKSRHLEMFEDKEGGSVGLHELENLSFKAATVWAQIYNLDFIRRIGAKFANNRNCEDNPFYFTCMANANSVSAINKELYFYRKRIDGSIAYYTKNWQDVLDNKNKSYEIIKQSKHSNELLKAYIPFYWTSCYYHCNSAINANRDLRAQIYRKLHELAMKLDKEYPMQKLKKQIDWKQYNKFKFSDKRIYHKLLSFMYRLFFVEESLDRRKIYLLGFKFSKKIKQINEGI